MKSLVKILLLLGYSSCQTTPKPMIVNMPAPIFIGVSKLENPTLISNIPPIFTSTQPQESSYIFPSIVKLSQISKSPFGSTSNPVNHNETSSQPAISPQTQAQGSEIKVSHNQTLPQNETTHTVKSLSPPVSTNEFPVRENSTSQLDVLGLAIASLEASARPSPQTRVKVLHLGLSSSSSVQTFTFIFQLDEKQQSFFLTSRVIRSADSQTLETTSISNDIESVLRFAGIPLQNLHQIFEFSFTPELVNSQLSKFLKISRIDIPSKPFSVIPITNPGSTTQTPPASSRLLESQKRIFQKRLDKRNVNSRQNNLTLDKYLKQ